MLLDPGCVVCESSRGPVCRRCEALLVPAPPVTVDGLDCCRAAFELDDRARTIIAALKYHRQRRIARWLGRAVEPLVALGCDAITWVPATPERQRQRGFDQAGEIARAVSRATGIPAVGLLRRDRRDHRQTGLDRNARLHGPEIETGRRSWSPEFVVLIDDVMTTGSSLRVAAEQLRALGAYRVVGVVAASTPRTPRLGLLSRDGRETQCKTDRNHPSSGAICDRQGRAT